MTQPQDRKVALITGAGRGIGFAAVQRFLREDYSVVAVDREAGRLASLSDDHLKVIIQDLAIPDCARVVDTAMSLFGRIDALLNIAGIGGAKSVTATSDDELARFMDTNFLSAFRISRAAVPVMRRPGAIVNITSVFALKPIAGASSYAASKSALHGLTREMAADFGASGLRVNLIAPGVILTEPVQERAKSDARYRRLMVERTPCDRLGQPEDIANACFFLASSDAGFINGQIIVVDGGFSTTTVCVNPD